MQSVITVAATFCFPTNFSVGSELSGMPGWSFVQKPVCIVCKRVIGFMKHVSLSCNFNCVGCLNCAFIILRCEGRTSSVS